MIKPSLIERAYELARSGECARLTDVKKRLLREGYENVRAHLDGKRLKAELVGLCAQVRRSAPADLGAGAH